MKRLVIMGVACLLLLAGGVAVAVTHSSQDDRQRITALKPADRANALLGALVTPDGWRAVPAAPSPHLVQPPESLGDIGLVVRSRFWTVPQPWASLVARLRSLRPVGFRSDQSGSAAGPALGDTIRYDVFHPVTRPAGVSAEEMIVAVNPLTRGRSGVGAYALVVPQPARPPGEAVPASSTVTLQAVASALDHEPLSTLVTGAAATKLVRAFRALPVSTVGVHSCPAQFGEQLRAIFRSGGHVWVVTYDYCGEVAVTRDGARQPSLLVSPTFLQEVQRGLGIGVLRRPTSERLDRRVTGIDVGRLTGTAGPHMVHARPRLAAELADTLDRLPTLGSRATCAASGPDVAVLVVHEAHLTLTIRQSPCDVLMVTNGGRRLAPRYATGLWDQIVEQAVRRR